MRREPRTTDTGENLKRHQTLFPDNEGRVEGGWNVPSSRLPNPFPFLLDKALDIEGRRETGVADERDWTWKEDMGWGATRRTAG